MDGLKARRLRRGVGWEAPGVRVACGPDEREGALVGVTGQSIYKWESGGARPRASQLRAIAGVRALGKREARAKLEELSKQ